MHHIVVMETTVAQRKLWAWCRHSGGAGFDECAFTLPDGVTPAEAPPGTALERHLFTVAVFDEADP